MGKKKARRKKKPEGRPPERRKLPRWQVVLLVLFGLAILSLTIGLALAEMQRMAETDTTPVLPP